MNNSYFTDALDDLQDYIDNNEVDEMGYEVSLNAGIISTNFVEGHFGGVELNHGGNIIGGMHTHPEPGVQFFSEYDIYKLYAYAMTNHEASTYEMLSVLITNNGTYMIKIRDLNNLHTIFDQLGSNVKRSKRKLRAILEVNYYNDNNITEDSYTGGLLEAFEKLKIKFSLNKTPITLYKLNEGGLTFDKVELNSANEPIDVPCN